MKLGQVKSAVFGQHARGLVERAVLQVVRQFVQQEKHDVDVDAAVLETQRGGVVGDEVDAAAVVAEFAGGMQQFVFDDVDHQDAARTGFQRRVDQPRDHVAERAGGDQHGLAVEVRAPQRGGDFGHQPIVMKQQDRGNDPLVIDQPDQPHVGVNRVDVRGDALPATGEPAKQQRTSGQREKEQRHQCQENEKGEKRVYQ